MLEHLACIGFGCGEGGKIYLVDHDTVESSNLARIPYASRDDVGKQKADVALEYLNWKAPDAVAETLTLSVTETEVIERLKSCNLIFGCTDSDYSRKALNELSISCLIPYIDLGCGIVPKEGSEYFSGGQVRVVMPGVGPCLACTNGLDPNRTARETFSEEEVGMRVSAGYVQGFESNPTASIFHLNTTIASQGISQAIKMILDEDLSKQFYLFYDQRKGRLKPMPAAMHHRCPICGPGGILGSGTGYIKTTYEKIENIPEEISVRD